MNLHSTLPIANNLSDRQSLIATIPSQNSLIYSRIAAKPSQISMVRQADRNSWRLMPQNH
jgi:hypothetical protein